MPYTILEVRALKRLSKRIKKCYMPLKPGEVWMDAWVDKQRVTIVADIDNTCELYVGRSDQKLAGK